MTDPARVERIARVLYQKLASDPDWDDAPATEAQRVSGDDDPSQEECLDIARAIIVAMDEPALRSGIDIARIDAPLHAAVLDNFKDQLLIVFLKLLGGQVSIPLSVVDDTGKDLLAFRIDENKTFHFELQKKQ